MAGINKVTLIGNLGADPETRYLPDGTAIAHLRLATSDSWRDKVTGERQERTEWHRVAIFGKLAEIASQYLSKGAKVYLEGALRTRKWQDQSGQDRYTTEIVLSGPRAVMQMLDGRDKGASQGASHASQARTNARAPGAPSAGQKAATAALQAPGAVDFDDDIPF